MEQPILLPYGEMKLKISSYFIVLLLAFVIIYSKYEIRVYLNDPILLFVFNILPNFLSGIAITVLLFVLPSTRRRERNQKLKGAALASFLLLTFHEFVLYFDNGRPIDI